MARVEVVRPRAAIGVNAPEVPAGRAVVADVLVGRDGRGARHLDPLRAVPAPEIKVEVRAGGTAEVAVLKAGVAEVVGAAGLVLGLAQGGDVVGERVAVGARGRA